MFDVIHLSYKPKEMPRKGEKLVSRQKQVFGYRADPVHKIKAEKKAEKQGTTLSKLISDFVTTLATNKA